MKSSTTLVIITLALLQICAGLTKFTFTDTQIFYDLSTYNFNNGEDISQEFKLTAKAGQKINLYLFQSDINQYKLSVFDGVDATAAPISTDGKIPRNADLSTIPIPISSTGPNMFVKVEAVTVAPAFAIDFQAMATTYAQPAGCTDLVVSVNLQDQDVKDHSFPTNAQRQCIYVLHANDVSNNYLLGQYINSDKDLNASKFQIFKGLQMSTDRELVYNQWSTTTWATDKYLIVYPSDTVKLSFGWTYLGGLNSGRAVGQFTHGQLMSVDFLRNAYPYLTGPLQQIWTIGIDRPMRAIQISILKLFGTGSLEVIAYSNGKSFSDTIYLPGQVFGPINVTYGCDLIKMIYKTDLSAAGSSGFYGLYDDATDYKINPVVTLTPPTVETATKSAQTKSSVPQSTTDRTATRLSTQSVQTSSTLSQKTTDVSQSPTSKSKTTKSPTEETTKIANSLLNSYIASVIATYLLIFL